jgi:beta propeller repeat protein
MAVRSRSGRELALRVSAALIVAAVIPLAGRPQVGEAQADFTVEDFSVAKRDNDQVRPRISGKYIVWQDYRNLPGKTYNETQANADIYGYNLDSSDDFKITTNATSARPAVSGARVVYSDSRTQGNGLDIRGYNIANGDNFDVVEKSGDQDYPAIDGAVVVWQDNRSGNWDIRGYDIDKDDNFDVIVRDGDQKKPAVSGRMVVWEDYRAGGNSPDIYMSNLDNDDKTRITDNGESREPAIWGDWIAYKTGDPNSSSQRIRLYNWKTQERRTISDNQRIIGGPRVADGLVVWADRRNDEDYNIFAYDIASGSSFRVNGDDKDQTNPDLSGMVAVWQDVRSGNADIRAGRISGGQAAATPTSGTGAPPVGPPAQTGPCGFQLGFKLLRDQISSTVGDCLENEWHNAENGDALQRTTGGLMVWRKADNWTAFTNGSITWLNGPCGLQTRPNQGPFFAWEGRPGSGCV